MKQQCEELLDLTEWTHQAEDQNNYRNCHPFDSHKMTGWKEDSLAEDFPEEEDSPEEEEDSLEEEDIQVEEEYHQEDRQEEVGGHHRYPCRKHNKENLLHYC